MIQPLVLRANQGECVKMILRNHMEGEDSSLFIQASSMVMSPTGKPATTTNPDSIVAPGKAQEFEWYIHPKMQEGVRQFHSYSHDRELTVLGLFGAFFIVEPQGARYLDTLGRGGPAPEVKSGWQVNMRVEWTGRSFCGVTNQPVGSRVTSHTLARNGDSSILRWPTSIVTTRA